LAEGGSQEFFIKKGIVPMYLVRRVGHYRYFGGKRYPHRISFEFIRFANDDEKKPLKGVGMAYPKSNDPIRSRGVSISDSLWECLKDHARNDQRSTSAYISILLFEAINARRQKLGLPAFDSPEDLQAATQKKMTEWLDQKANAA
jgi:hypothetical protein